MVTQFNLIFSIAAAQRILGRSVYEVRVWAWVVLVRGVGFCRFMSKKDFLNHFADRRKAESKKITVVVNPRNENEYKVVDKDYTLKVFHSEISCNCEDYKNQLRYIGKGICKHGYAVLNHLGFSSLSTYIETKEAPRATMPPVRLSNQRADGKRAPRGRSVD